MKTGLQYQAIFDAWVLSHAEDVLLRIEDQSGATRCAGAFNPFNNEYDPARDRAYHTAHPLASVCDYGIINAVTNDVDAQAFLGFDLKKEELEMLGLDELKEDEVLFFFNGTEDLTQVREIEYPSGSANWYGVLRKDTWRWRNTPLYQYVAANLLTVSEGKGT